MRPDDNWRETRLLAKDLNDLLGLPQGISENYFDIIENLLVHKFLEIVLSKEDPKESDYQIELPYLGSLIISIDDKNRLSTSFVVRDSLYRKLKEAYSSKRSPLVDQCAKILGDELAKKFEDGEILNGEEDL